MQPKNLWTVCAVLLLFTGSVGADSKKDDMHSDLWLKAKIVTAFTLNQHLNPFTLDVEVNQGVAHLSGTVDSAVERDLAVEIAKGVDGIREVREEIRIEPGTMADKRQESEFFRKVEDATITARVKSRLLWNRNTNGLDIEVTTSKGVVTLGGQVTTDTQGDLAVELAKNTTGVELVKNRLEVVAEQDKGKSKGTIKKIEEQASDAWITTKVRSQLLFSTETKGADIAVNTAAQVVTLKGTVVSKRQQDKILQMTGDIVGVKEVRSELRVEK
jgi:osmotically-inducible protein OsmY